MWVLKVPLYYTNISLFSIEIFFTLVFTSLPVYNLRPFLPLPSLQYYFYFLYSEAEPKTKYENMPEVEVWGFSNGNGDASFGRWEDLQCHVGVVDATTRWHSFVFNLTWWKIYGFYTGTENKDRTLTILWKWPCLLYMLSFLLCFAHIQK